MVPKWCQDEKPEPGTVVTYHVKIDIDTIRVALAAAAVNKAGRDRWMDTEERHLMLERRGDRVAWFVKNRDFTRKLGDVRKGSYKAADQLTPSDARREAAKQLTDLRLSQKPKPAEKPQKVVWTWSQLVDARLESLAGERVVRSRQTQEDVRQAFGINSRTKVFDASKRPSLSTMQGMSLSTMQGMSLNDLDAEVLGDAMRAIEHRRPREKFLAYAKSALSWAYSNIHKSGFKPTGTWWTEIEPPELDKEGIKKFKAFHAVLLDRKISFTVQHVGQVLARSEAFCADRTSNEKISPGIRFGIWWWALTANRRGSTARLERANVVANDPFNDLPGWGSAFWDAGEMKGRKPFLIGVPPTGMHVINLSISDWQVLVTESHSKDHKSKWVYASTRRVQRIGVADDLDTDIPIHPSSLADYIRNMRGIKDLAKDENGNYDPAKRKPDFLKGIPDFSLHTVRSAATNFFDGYVGLPPAAASAFLGHGHKADRNDPDAMNEVTEKFYLVSQRMPLKIKAMQAWSDAVMEAYEKEGGRRPQPYPPPNPKKLATKNSGSNLQVSTIL